MPTTEVAETAADAAGFDVGSEILAQRQQLAAATQGSKIGPQAPRDLGSKEGRNVPVFAVAPSASELNLCNIHFHKNAEHRGGEFTAYAGDGDGKGYNSGFRFSGSLSRTELRPVATPVGANDKGSLEPGDTIEIHFVHSSADITPGATLASCLSADNRTPALRVETVVAVLVNDTDAADFKQMAKVEKVGDLWQVPNLPTDLGEPVQYAGSTTGPSYNTKGSPFQVTWSVPLKVVKVSIDSVGAWLDDNRFDETAAHGVRNLVVNPDLLSPIDG
ncbi:MAG: delta-class carbonic anhydrase [Pseudomonadota bacterium]